MPLDIGITSGMELKESLELLQVAEKSGLNCVWVGEDITAPHNVFTVASIMLLKSSQINVSIGITSPLVRNISTVARASVSLAEIADNRHFRLGLGIGGLQDLAKLGIPVKNVESLMRNATTLLKRIWKGEAVSFHSSDFNLEHYYNRYGFRSQIPIFFGVRGPKMLKVAGAVADGVILSGPRTYLEKALEIVRKSLKESQEPSRSFRFVVWVPTILVENRRDFNIVKRTIAFVLADTPRGVVEMADLNYNKIEKIKSTYRRSGIAKASSLITEDLMEEIAIRGNLRQMCEVFKSYEKLGVQEIVFGPPYGTDPKQAVTKLAQTWRRFS